MRRTDLVELHDHRWFPAFLRNLVTDALQVLWQFGNSYGPILSRLYRGLTANSPTTPVRVVDLCSGGGGPWLRLSSTLDRDFRLPIRVCLTDKYPNRDAFEEVRARCRLQSGSRSDLDFVPVSIDATQVPPELRGFRTIFSSFHHFGPRDAREILHDAVQSDEGIGVFELAKREVKTMLVLCFVPLLVLVLTPRIRPFRWSRLFWTYVVPVVPFVIWFDGIVSCLRAYGLEELREMIRKLPETASKRTYRWQLGEERTGLLPITYLIGSPESPDHLPGSEVIDAVMIH
jgi:hypothetical protein